MEALSPRRQYGSLGYDGFHAWEILEGRYTLAVLFEYAGTLGPLDLDYVHPTGAREELPQRTEHELPGSLRTLIGDVTRRATQLTDLGHARVIECADPALAALVTRDRALRSLCRPLGDRHLAVPLDQELKLRKALLKLGYVLPGQPTP